MSVDNTPEEYGPLIESMCRWEKTRDILELIADWLEESLVLKSTPQASGKRRVGFTLFILIVHLHIYTGHLKLFTIAIRPFKIDCMFCVRIFQKSYA